MNDTTRVTPPGNDVQPVLLYAATAADAELFGQYLQRLGLPAQLARAGGFAAALEGCREHAAPEVLEMARTERATAHEVKLLADHYEQRLDEAGFFFPPAKAEGMKMNLRNLWSRMPMTRADVQTLHGALRQIVRRRD